MKANQFAQKEEAQVGIGTMIVFISTILVAAVAAGVLVSVGSDLQSQSKATGEEASNEVANSLTLKRVYARDVIPLTDATNPEEADGDEDDDVADEFHVFVSLSAGAKPVDLSEAEVLLDTGDDVVTMQFVDITGAAAVPAANGNYFTVEESDALLTAEGAEINNGDLMNIRLLGPYDTVGGWGGRLNIEPGTEVGITIAVPDGSPLFGTFDLPAVMDTDYERLY